MKVIIMKQVLLVPRHRAFGSQAHLSISQLISKTKQFESLLTYLTQSRISLSNHRRTEIPTSPSSLPYDILLNIVKYVDWKTTVTLSATSKLLKECVEGFGPKLGNLHLQKYDAASEFFFAYEDGDNLVKMKIHRRDFYYNPSSDTRHYAFKFNIRYPGVRLNFFVPMLEFIALSSDAAELKEEK